MIIDSLCFSHTVPIQVYSPEPEHFQQSSNEIWDAVCTAVGTVSRKVNQMDKVAGAPTTTPPTVLGIGFAATCSLVVLGNAGIGLRCAADACMMVKFLRQFD